MHLTLTLGILLTSLLMEHIAQSKVGKDEIRLDIDGLL